MLVLVTPQARLTDTRAGQLTHSPHARVLGHTDHGPPLAHENLNALYPRLPRTPPAPECCAAGPFCDQPHGGNGHPTARRRDGHT